MKMKYSLFAVLLLIAMPMSAEVLVIDKVEQSSAIGVPGNGMSMEAVRARYGDPQDIIDPVGEPPITRWVYPDFSVFFEYNQVIHSVVHRDRQ